MGRKARIKRLHRDARALANGLLEEHRTARTAGEERPEESMELLTAIEQTAVTVVYNDALRAGRLSLRERTVRRSCAGRLKMLELHDVGREDKRIVPVGIVDVLMGSDAHQHAFKLPPEVATRFGVAFGFLVKRRGKRPETGSEPVHPVAGG